MKEFILSVMCLFLFFLFHPAFADDDGTSSNSNWGIPPASKDEMSAQNSGSAEEAWSEEYNQTIYERYGSDESPAFNNRENINPNESDYGYGETDGYE
ncbi:MAG: hypothetical protein WCY19_08825 [Candidatus Gastranaerophilaceae bacterium]